MIVRYRNQLYSAQPIGYVRAVDHRSKILEIAALSEPSNLSEKLVDELAYGATDGI